MRRGQAGLCHDAILSRPRVEEKHLELLLCLCASGPTNQLGHPILYRLPCRIHSNAATVSSLWNSKAPRPMSTGKPSTRNATSRKTVDRTPRHRTRIPQKIDKITAIEMARKARIDARLFSQVLRDENFDWHKRHDRWTVEIGSAEHKAMQPVLNLISKGRWRIDRARTNGSRKTNAASG